MSSICSTNLCISDLPTEIIDYIFTFLTVKERFRTELVCRHWRKISKSLPWRQPTKVDVFELEKAFGKGIGTCSISPSILSRCGMCLQQLTISMGCLSFKLNSSVLSIIGDQCSNLADIRLNLWVFEADPELGHHLIKLGKGCGKLKQVRLASSDDMDDATLVEFLKLCPLLESLMLGNNPKITEKFVSVLSSTLKELYIYNCEGMCYQTFTKQLVNTCQSIEGFALLEANGEEGVPLALLTHILKYYKNTLKVFYMACYWDEYIVPENVLSECQLHPKVMLNLEVISLRCSYVDDNTLQLLANYCQQMKALDIMGCDYVSDLGVFHLASAPSLKVLDISGLNRVSGEGIKYLAVVGRLEKLRMNNLFGIRTRPFVGLKRYLENSLILLANSCPNLNTLDVTYNKFITNRLVEKVSASVEKGFLKKIVTLHVAGTHVSKDVKYCNKLSVSFEEALWLEEFHHLNVDSKNGFFVEI